MAAFPHRRRILFVTDFHEDEKLLGVVEHARRKGWDLISNMRFHGRFPSETEADGLLVTAYGERVQRWLKRWPGTPTVHIGLVPTDLNLPWVDVDHTAAGRLGAEHLLGLGHPHHAFYLLQDLPESRLLRTGFEARLTQAGRRSHRLDFSACHEMPPRDLRLQWLAERLLALPRPLAIMTSDDRRSLELIAACEIAGLSVPEDVAILGCENRAAEVNLSPVPLSSLDLARRQTGRRAAEMLDELMESGALPDRRHHALVAPAGVVPRASTEATAAAPPGIQRALWHLRDHYMRPLRLSDLARVAGMSERHFRSEFTRWTGRCPREEILRLRLDAACERLREGNLKLEAVAIESGFGSAKKLCETFSRTHGMSPHRWRLQHQRQGAAETTRGRLIA